MKYPLTFRSINFRRVILGKEISTQLDHGKSKTLLNKLYARFEVTLRENSNFNLCIYTIMVLNAILYKISL